MNWEDLVAKPQVFKKRDQPAEHYNENSIRIKEKNHDHQVSERWSNHSQGVAIRRLWSAVISQAIRDACKEPLRMTRNKRNSLKKVMGIQIEENKDAPRNVACRAMSFLFEPDRSDHVFQMLDINADYFRENLLKCMEGHKFSGKTAFTELITDMNKRCFRFNHRWFVNHQEAISKYCETHKKEEDAE